MLESVLQSKATFIYRSGEALYEECSDKEEKTVYMDINYTVRLSNGKHVNNPAVLYGHFTVCIKYVTLTWFLLLCTVIVATSQSASSTYH